MALANELESIAPKRKGIHSGQRTKEAVIRFLCFFCALLSVFTTFCIIFILAKETLGFFKQVSPQHFLFDRTWAPDFDKPQFGVMPLVVGTLIITLGSGLISIPMGVLTAIYLSEYARPRVRGVIKPALELLAGIPSVVYGYFGLFLITPLLQKLSSGFNVYSAAAGAIVVGIMTLPLVASLCEDAISSVPQALREGAYGLGATKSEVTVKIVIPAALSGIVASFILALSRAVGETMAVTLAAGNTPALDFNPMHSMETMTAFIVNMAKGDARAGSVEYNSIFAVGASLFAMTYLLNFVALRLVKRYRRAY